MKRIWDRIGIVVYNFFVTQVPFYAVRHAVLRLWGAKIGRGSSVFRGTTVLGIDKLVIGERPVWHKIHIRACIKGIGLSDSQRPGGAVRAFCADQRPGFARQMCGERRVVPVRVADEDVAYRPPVNGLEKCPQMGFVFRTGIDDR